MVLISLNLVLKSANTAAWPCDSCVELDEDCREVDDLLKAEDIFSI